MSDSGSSSAGLPSPTLVFCNMEGVLEILLILWLIRILGFRYSPKFCCLYRTDSLLFAVVVIDVVFPLSTLPIVDLLDYL